MGKQPKNRIVSLRLTEAEHDEMAASAARDGRTLTDHIRIKTLGLDRTFFRWEVEPPGETVAAPPGFMVWFDGTTGQTWPASSATACR